MGHNIELAVMSEMLDDEVRGHAATRQALEKAVHEATVLAEKAEKAEKDKEKIAGDLTAANAKITALQAELVAAKVEDDDEPPTEPDNALITQLQASLASEQASRAEAEKRMTVMMQNMNKPMTLSMPAHKPSAYKMVVTGRDGNNDIRSVSIVPEK